MNYLVTRFRCLCVGEEKFELLPNVKYCVENVDNHSQIFYGFSGEIPTCVNFAQIESCKNLISVNFEKDKYYFLSANKYVEPQYSNFKILSMEISVVVASSLYISINGECVVEKQAIDYLKYSHYEQFGDYILMYFVGSRNFVVILKGKEIQFAEFYDEANVTKEERYFMCKLNDILNHGKVAHVKPKQFEEYIVYLDENELKMKNEFVHLVFLDCLLAENLKYCNFLLCEDIKQKDEKGIKKFFPQFDDYYAVDNGAILFKKNTLVGVFKFEVNELKIQNIIRLD